MGAPLRPPEATAMQRPAVTAGLVAAVVGLGLVLFTGDPLHSPEEAVLGELVAPTLAANTPSPKHNVLGDDFELSRLELQASALSGDVAHLSGTDLPSSTVVDDKSNAVPDVSKIPSLAKPECSVRTSASLARAESRHARLSTRHAAAVSRSMRLERALQKHTTRVASITKARHERRAAYGRLRAALMEQLSAASAELQKYKRSRALAVKYEERCEHRVRSRCRPGPEGTPLCSDEKEASPFCRYAEKYARLAATHASSIKVSANVRRQLREAQFKATE